MIRTVIATALLLGASTSIAAPTMTDAEYSKAKADVSAVVAKLLKIDDEVEAIERNRSALSASRPVLMEEVRAAKRMFPGLVTSGIDSVDSLIAALKAERARLGDGVRAKAVLVKDVSVGRTCQALRNFRSTFQKLYDSPDWTKVSLDERLEMRQLVEAFIKENVGDDERMRADIEQECGDMLNVPEL